jgi:hypothetical protein
MELTIAIAPSEDVVAREVSGEFVLMDLESGTYFGLNQVGSRIWKAVEEAPSSLAALCDIVEAEFDAPRDVIERDVAELAKDLLEQGLITKQ